MTHDIRKLHPADLAIHLDALADILLACVADGASVSFVFPFSQAEATTFWLQKVFPAVQNGETVLLGSFLNGELVGTVQLCLGLPANQQHRGDVSKLLVHPKARRAGLARALMQALEEETRKRGKVLLVLDTRSGDPSQRLYESLGYQVAGSIPGFCKHPTEEHFEATTYLYKALD